MEKFGKKPNGPKESPDVQPTKDMGALVRRLRLSALADLATRKDSKDEDARLT